MLVLRTTSATIYADRHLTQDADRSAFIVVLVVRRTIMGGPHTMCHLWSGGPPCLSLSTLCRFGVFNNCVDREVMIYRQSRSLTLKYLFIYNTCVSALFSALPFFASSSCSFFFFRRRFLLILFFALIFFHLLLLAFFSPSLLLLNCCFFLYRIVGFFVLRLGWLFLLLFVFLVLSFPLLSTSRPRRTTSHRDRDRR